MTTDIMHELEITHVSVCCFSIPFLLSYSKSCMHRREE